MCRFRGFRLPNAYEPPIGGWTTSLRKKETDVTRPHFRDLMPDDLGQDLVEYALLLALVAIVAVAGVLSLGSGINATYADIGSAISTAGMGAPPPNEPPPTAPAPSTPAPSEPAPTAPAPSAPAPSEPAPPAPAPSAPAPSTPTPGGGNVNGNNGNT